MIETWLGFIIPVSCAAATCMILFKNQRNWKGFFWWVLSATAGSLAVIIIEYYK